MDLQLMLESLPHLLKGALTTLKITGISGSMGVVLGTLIGLGRTSGSKWLSAVLVCYVEILRGTPLYVQLLIGVFGIPAALDVQVNEFTAAVIIIGINSSAYVAEIMRGGIQSIDKGQMEAARSTGMTHGQAMLYIVLPQAFKRAIPPLVNEMITLIKESSLVAAVAIVELTRVAQMISSRTYKPFEVYITSALVYLVMTLTLSRIAARLERRLKVSD